MTPRSPHRLSARLEALLELLEPCRVLADVGTDHALVPAHAVLRGLAERAIAVDLRAAPLRGAQRTLAELGVSEKVRLLEGDALAALAGMGVDAVVLAGLGGDTFASWLEAAPEVVRSLTRLVVQPNRKLAGLRRRAHQLGLHLLHESIRLEGGRHFITCAYAPGAGEPDPAYQHSELSLEEGFELGPFLFARRDALTLDYYRLQAARFSGFVTSGRSEHAARLAAFERGLAGPQRG